MKADILNKENNGYNSSLFCPPPRKKYRSLPCIYVSSLLKNGKAKKHALLIYSIAV